MTSLRSYSGLDAYHHQMHHHRHQQQQQQQQAGQAALLHMHALYNGAAEVNAELRSYEQRRRYLGLLDAHEQQQNSLRNLNVLDMVAKREDMFSAEPQARIGLNLGGRTYFSAEDSTAAAAAAAAAARLGGGGKRSRINALGTHAPMCQVQGCTADLSKAKHYHRRHKVCEIHSKAPNVIAGGHTQRFCQQCSRFHQLSEFDDTKRSCRKRLADHNRRRRKPQHSSGAIATISGSAEPFKTEEHISMRPSDSTMASLGCVDHKPMALMSHSQVNCNDLSGSPSASVTDRDSMSSCGAGQANNRLQVQQQSASYGTMDDKPSGGGRNLNALMRSQATPELVPSSDVQALVLSVVSRTPAASTVGTQESVYHQYLHGPSLSLSSAAHMNSAASAAAQAQSTQLNNNSLPSSRNINLHNNSIDQQQQQHSTMLPWLAPSTSCSNSRSTLVQPRPLQSYNPASASASIPARHDHQSGMHMQQQQQMAHGGHYLLHTGREQIGRLGMHSNVHVHEDHRMLALIENPAQQQQLTSSVVDDVKPPLVLHHHSTATATGVRSSFGSSTFYDSSSSIG